jgi:hypothetical protein
MFRLRSLILVAAGLTLPPLVALADEGDKELYRLYLRARKPSEKEMPRDRQPVAVHVFLDRDRLFYVADGGKVLAVVSAGKDAGDRKDRSPRLSHRLLLPVRTSDEDKIGEATAKVSAEVYRDENSGNLVYLTHEGAVAVVAGTRPAADKADKEAKWLGRFRMKVRENADDFGRAILHCSVEVYRDENTGCVIYAAEKGGFAVVAGAKAEEGKDERAAEWSHALSFRVRAPNEDDFTAKTATFVTEVYRDVDRDTWLYVLPSFRLAAVPARRKIAVGDKIEAVRWERRTGPKEIGAGKWSAEEFLNPNTGDRLFVTAAGALAVLPEPK